MITHIKVAEPYIADMLFDFELEQWRCMHTEAYLEHCCDGAPEEGRYTCACRGEDSVICPVIDCTGIEDFEIEELFDKIT